MVTQLGTILGTHLGTNLSGSSGSGGDVWPPLPMYALSGFTGANYYQTAVGGGEAGIASGFGVFSLLRVNALGAAASRHLTNRANAGGSQGWLPFLTTTNQITFLCADGVSAAIQAPVYQLLPSDVGRILGICAWHDGTKVRLAVNRVQALDGTAITGYTSVSVGTALANNAAAPTTNGIATSIDLLAAETFRGAPSFAQLQALYDAARTGGDVPATFPLGSATDTSIAATSPRHWWRGDTYTGGASLTALTNRNLTVGGQLAVTAGTVPLPAADAALNGMLSIALNGSQWLDASMAAAEFGFIHNGTGCTTVTVLVPTGLPSNHHVWATRNGSLATETGAHIRLAAANFRTDIGNGTTTIALAQVTASPPVVGQPMMIISTYQEGALTEVTLYRDGEVGGTLATSPGPSASAPDGTFRLGAGVAGFSPLQARVADVLLYNRVVSSAEMQTIKDYVRTRYSFTSMNVVASHRWSLKDTLAGSLVITDGQTAPASMPDTVTGAAADVMARQGSPIVRVIDTTVDGRKTYGALGFSTANHLKTANAAGIVGSGAGFHVGFWYRPESFAGTRVLCGTMNAAAGWWIQISGSQISFVVADATGAEIPLHYVIPASDVMQPHYYEAVHTGAGGQLVAYWDGVAVGSAGITGFKPEPALPMVVGWCNKTSTTPATLESIYGLTGGNVVPTAQQVADNYRAIRSAGRIRAIVGDQHLYDLTQDVAANGGPDAGFPLQVRDRIGTDHLTRVGGLQVVNGGLTSFGASGYPQSLTVASGLPGLATGIWVEALIVAPAVTGAHQAIFGNSGASANGLTLRFNSIGTLSALFGDGATVLTAFGSGVLTVGQTYHVAVVYDGSVGKVYTNGAALGTATASFVYVPGSQPTKLGTAYAGTSEPSTTVNIRGVAGGHDVPTPAEIAAASAYALANGKVGGIPGKTLRLYDLVQDIADAAGKPIARIKDRISGVDHLPIIGSPLQVAQRVERLWGWEAA